MKYPILLILICCGLFINLETYAQSDNHTVKIPDKIKGLHKKELVTSDDELNSFVIPSLILNEIRVGMYSEVFIVRVLDFIRQNANDKYSLQFSDITAEQEKQELAYKKNQIREFLRFDSNADGEISLEELKNNSANNFAKENKELDTNQNGLLSFDEIVHLTKPKKTEIYSKVYDTFHEYLKLDPDNDRKLTVDELKDLAIKSFRIIDSNIDGLISKDELDQYQKKAELIHLTKSPSSWCQIAPVEEGAKVKAIWIYEGASLSSVTVSNKDTLTTAVKVHIEDDLEDSYIFLSSTLPTIWELTGNTNSIKNVVISNSLEHSFSSYQDKNDFLITGEKYEGMPSLSGITGISAEKVKFIDGMCLPLEYFPPERYKRAIKTITGKEPDYFAGGHWKKIAQVNIFNDKATFKKIDALQLKRPPAGFDTKVWPQVIANYPDGVSFIDKEKVISLKKAENYDVLPIAAGLSQLVYQGALEIVDSYQIQWMSIGAVDIPPNDPRMTVPNKFRILKEIPRFPAGLLGHLGVTFVLPEDVKFPKAGHYGNSCVVIEKTKKKIGNTYKCSEDKK